jgi:hypothetical protein
MLRLLLAPGVATHQAVVLNSLRVSLGSCASIHTSEATTWQAGQRVPLCDPWNLTAQRNASEGSGASLIKQSSGALANAATSSSSRSGDDQVAALKQNARVLGAGAQWQPAMCAWLGQSFRGLKLVSRKFELPQAIKAALERKLAAAEASGRPARSRIPSPPRPRPWQERSRRVGCIAVKAGMTQVRVKRPG